MLTTIACLLLLLLSDISSDGNHFFLFICFFHARVSIITKSDPVEEIRAQIKLHPGQAQNNGERSAGKKVIRQLF